MINYTPRAARVLFIHKIALIVLSVAVGYSSLGILNFLFPSLEGFGMWVAFLVMSWVGIHVSSQVAFFAILFSVYGGDTQAMEDEVFNPHLQPSKPEPAEVTLTILGNSGEPIAKYLDADIWEWIDFAAADGTKYRGTYEGTMNFRYGGGEIPANCMLLPPGIIYKLEPLETQVEEPLNTPS